MCKLARVLLFVFSCLFTLAAQAQVAVISGQAIDTNGTPLPFAQIRVCSVTSTGTPCTPTAPNGIFQDFGLTIPSPNPATADQYGNYVLYAPSLPAPNLYTVQFSPASGITWSYVFNGPFFNAGGGTLYGSLFAPNINGEIYPAACGRSPAPTWCTGTTADDWIRAACEQLPSTGGFESFLGLTGTWAASVACTSPTKQVIFLQDPTSLLSITEADGGTPLVLDSGSMFLGPGAGQCNQSSSGSGGIHLTSGANITSIVGPAHTDGTQENFTAQGLCIQGANGATVSKGLIYTKATFANTTISDNNANVCNGSCAWVENPGGTINIENNWFNVTSGVYTINGSGLVIASSGGAGCEAQDINIFSNTIEHANGGSGFPEVNIFGNDAGAQACSVNISKLYTEKNISGTPSTAGIKIRDCLSCKFEDIQGGGGNSTSGDLINLSASSPLRVQNVIFDNISNVFGSWTNTINDTTNGNVLPFSTYPFVTDYISNPGYQQPPVLPGTIIQSVSGDVLLGAGNFETGSSTLGTNFHATGCIGTVNCTYTRTNSTAAVGTYSQQIQITTNTDTSSGFNGVESLTPFAFTAGQQYVATFWGKGDGTFAGFPTFLLWVSTTPVFYCESTTSTPFTTTWTLYAFTCTPSVSGTANLAVAARTPVGGTSGSTGTFYLDDFIFAPVQPLPPASLLTSVTPYGIGPATTAQQTININSVPCELSGSCTLFAGATGTFASPSSITVANGITTAVTPTAGAVTGTFGSPSSITFTSGIATAATTGPVARQTEALIITTGICSTGSTASSTCTMSPVSWPQAFPDSNYSATCTPNQPTTGLQANIYVTKSPSAVTITLQNGQGSAAQVTTVSEVDCFGIHP